MILFCSSTSVKLTLLRPAVIDVPQHIKTLVIIDRTASPESRVNALEEVMTGELMRQDEQAAQNAIEGVVETIQNAPRFKIIRGTERYKGESSGMVFPEALPWRIIQNLCQKYNADGVVAIETLDSDYIVTNTSRKVEEQDKDGNKILVVKHYAEGVATINLGFRMYDPTGQGITDQYHFSETRRWQHSGATPAAAVQGMIDKTASINQTSRYAGNLYGERISPVYYTISRYIYDKPKKNSKLTEGVRKSKVADWDGAIDAWMVAYRKGKAKHRGRAAYNIAVAYEVLGDLDKALEWSAKAYTEFDEKRADEYHHALKRRINEEAIVRMQMGEQ